MLNTNGAYYDEIYFGVTAAEGEKIDPPILLRPVSARDETAGSDTAGGSRG